MPPTLRTRAAKVTGGSAQPAIKKRRAASGVSNPLAQPLASPVGLHPAPQVRQTTQTVQEGPQPPSLALARTLTNFYYYLFETFTTEADNACIRGALIHLTTQLPSTAAAVRLT